MDERKEWRRLNVSLGVLLLVLPLLYFLLVVGDRSDWC